MPDTLTFEEATPPSEVSFEDAAPQEQSFTPNPPGMVPSLADKPYNVAQYVAGGGPMAGMAMLPSTAKDPFSSLIPPIPRIQGKTTLGQIAAAPINVASGFIEGATSPLGVASAATLGAAPAAVQGVAGVGFGLPAFAQGIHRVYAGTAFGEPQEALEGALEAITGGLITAGGAKAVIQRSAPILPRAAKAAAETIKEAEKGVPDASSVEKTAEVHGDVQPQPVQSAGEVPAKEGSPGVQPQASAVAQEAPLSLKPEEQAAEQQRLAQELSFEEAKPEPPASEARFTPEHIDWDKPNSWEPVTAAESSDPAALEGKLRSQEAGRVFGEPVSSTRRLVALRDPGSGKVHVVSAYLNTRSGLMMVDPALAKTARPNRPAAQVTKKYVPQYTMLLKDPVQKFSKTYDSLDDFFGEFGSEARQRAIAGSKYAEPPTVTESTPSSEPVEPEKAVVLDHMRRHPDKDGATAAISASPNRRRIRAAINATIDEVQKSNPELTDEEAAGKAVQELYEQSKTGKPKPEGGVATAGEAVPQGQPEAEKLTEDESNRLQALTDKLEGGEKLTAGEQRRYRALRDKATQKHPEAAPAGISVGPGAASPGDVPAAPRQAIAAGAKVEQAAPEDKPLGAMSDTGVRIRSAIKAVRSTVRGMAGHTLPKTTAADRVTGEAGARYLSSRIASRPLAQTFAARVLEGTDVDPVRLGAALTEDNLRSVEDSLRSQATELRASGDHAGSDRATEAADNVATIIGSKGSPFASNAEFHDFLDTPEAQRAVAQHIQLWREVIDPQYRLAREMDPEAPLPTRGRQTGARINLKSILPQDTPITPIRSGVGSPSLTGTFKRRSPFAITAKGSGDIYDINYNEIVANTFERQLEIANKNAFDKSLVDSGNAVIDSPGKQVTIQGERGVAFPLARKTVVTPKGQTIPMARNIYIRQSLAKEYESASNVNPKQHLAVVTAINTGLNKLALAGFTDFTVHTSNLMTALFNRPVSGGLLRDTLLSVTGRADIPVTLFKAMTKAFQNNQAQIAELSEIAAMRPPQGKFTFKYSTGAILQAMDRTTRLLLDDTFKSLVREGLFENTETARREYVNQVGQYNSRAQGPMTRWLRETGFGPFVTAGKTFNALGVRMVTLSPGAKATSPLAAAALRSNALSKWVGGTVLLSALNYLFTKKMAGRPGTPFGNIDLGTNDKTGRQQSFPLFALIGLGRGLRATGLQGAIQSKRLGLSNADAMDSASRDIINSWAAPGLGPPVRTAVIAATGYQPAINVGRASRIAPPGSSQVKENFLEAAAQVSPVIHGDVMYLRGSPISEVMASQLPRFAMSPGKSERTVRDYPKIVTAARAKEFTDDMISQAKKLAVPERFKFVQEQINRLPPESRARANNEARRRRVYSQ